MAPAIAVLGSLNIDLTTRTPRIPSAGETLTASSFNSTPGGKGANQAVACARLSHDAAHQRNSDVTVQMVGFVGADPFADEILHELERHGVGVAGVRKLQGHKTGVAVILVEESGENRILLAPNANHAWPRLEAGRTGLVPEGADVVVVQLEIELDTVLSIIQEANDREAQVILNPAPAVPLPQEIYKKVTHLILNESEACILSGREPADLSQQDCCTIGDAFVQYGVQYVVITLGAKGVYFRSSTADKDNFIPAYPVSVRETTGAGDTFVGAYAVAVARSKAETNNGYDLWDATNFANAAAAITVQREGAMSAIPTADEVRLFIEKKA